MTAARWALAVGSLYGLIGVAFGAFGAHALKQRLSSEMLAVWKTAVEYQLIHALALLLVAVLINQRPAPALVKAAFCFGLGSLVFSGSLYTLVLSDVRWLGAITPLGGLLLLAGWALCLRAAFKP